MEKGTHKQTVTVDDIFYHILLILAEEILYQGRRRVETNLTYFYIFDLLYLHYIATLGPILKSQLS